MAKGRRIGRSNSSRESHVFSHSQTNRIGLDDNNNSSVSCFFTSVPHPLCFCTVFVYRSLERVCEWRRGCIPVSSGLVYLDQYQRDTHDILGAPLLSSPVTSLRLCRTGIQYIFRFEGFC